MGESSRINSSGDTRSYQRVRHGSNGGSSVKGETRMVRRKDGTYEQKHFDPSVNDRFGELTVLGNEIVKTGACSTRMVIVQCSCGAKPHKVQLYNLLKGASTR